MKRLTDIEITEISLVDEPANPGARMKFFKRAPGSKSDIWEQIEDLVDAMLASWETNHPTKPKPATRAQALAILMESRAGQTLRDLWEKAEGKKEKQMKKCYKSEVAKLGEDFAKCKYPDAKTKEQALAKFVADKSPESIKWAELYKQAAPDPPKVEEIPKPRHTDAYRRIEMMAKDLVSKGKVPTVPQGVAKVAREHPELWLQHLREQEI